MAGSRSGSAGTSSERKAVNGSHIAGSGLGALLGVALAALGSRVGLHLDDTTAAMLGTGCVGVGLALGHAFGKAWNGVGVFPSLGRGFFGPRHPSAPAAAGQPPAPPAA